MNFFFSLLCLDLRHDLVILSTALWAVCFCFSGGFTHPLENIAVFWWWGWCLVFKSLKEKKSLSPSPPHLSPLALGLCVAAASTTFYSLSWKDDCGAVHRQMALLICKGLHFHYLHLPNIFLMRKVSRQFARQRNSWSGSSTLMADACRISSWIWGAHAWMHICIIINYTLNCGRLQVNILLC